MLSLRRFEQHYKVGCFYEIVNFQRKVVSAKRFSLTWFPFCV